MLAAIFDYSICRHLSEGYHRGCLILLASLPVPRHPLEVMLGMDASMLKQLKELEAENKRLKKMYAEAKLGQDILKEAMAKKW